MPDFLEQPAGSADSGGAETSGSATPETQVTDAGSTELDTGLPEGQQTQIEEEELDLDGLKFKVPKAAKDYFLRHGDYTQKTQEVAEIRRSLEAREQEFQQRVQMQQQFMGEAARMTAIDDRLQQFSQVNWLQLHADNPQQAQALQAEYMQLQAARGQLVGSLTQRQTQMREAQQREIAKRVSQAEAILKREIKDWSPAKDRELAAYAQSVGIDPRVVGEIALQAPGVMVALYESMQLRQIRKDAAKAPPPPPPGTRVGGTKGSGTKPLGEVTDPAEWQARRNERKGRNR